MSPHACPQRSMPSRRWSPSLERLEERQLLTVTTSSYYSALAATVRHEYDHFVSEVSSIELQSQATPADYLALRDDARAISEAAATSSLPIETADARALAVSVQIDRAPLYGSLSDQAWAEQSSKLSQNVAGLNVPPAIVDRTIADMQAVAASAGVSSDSYQTFLADFTQLRLDESRVPAGYGHFTDPGLFYTQHLRGFFRGWAVARTADAATLTADLQGFANHSAPAFSVLNRDTQILKTLGSPIPSASNDQLLDDFVAAFAQGPPSKTQLATLRTQIIALLGTTATAGRIASVDRLIADATAFFQASGSSPSNVATIANDVQAVVDDGAGASLNPFKVTVRSSA